MTAPSLFIADESGFSTGFFGNGFGKCRAALCPLIVVSLFHFCRLADGLPFHFLGEFSQQAYRCSSPGIGAEIGEFPAGNATFADFLQQGPDFGEEFAVVGRRTHDQRVVFENVADDIRNVGIRKVVNDDVFTPCTVSSRAIFSAIWAVLPYIEP